jgi:hypothetical protein
MLKNKTFEMKSAKMIKVPVKWFTRYFGESEELKMYAGSRL